MHLHGEGLSYQTSENVKSSYLDHESRFTLNISHFLFVDNKLIFCGAIPNHLRNLRCLFLCFAVISGMGINLAKL